ncbi:MAG: cupin domain-containing protein, partial [Mesorhizobium sp.]
MTGSAGTHRRSEQTKADADCHPSDRHSSTTHIPRRPDIKILLCAALTAVPFTAAIAKDADSVKLVYDHVLPNVPGKSIKAVLVEYGPGGTSPAHTHPKSAFIYATVLEGAIRSQVNDGPAKTYRAGESFSEFPGDHHA